MLNALKTFTDSLESIATVIALIIGGYWTYMRFIRQRSEKPRMGISHSVSQSVVSDDWFIVHAEINLANQGNVLIPLIAGKSILRQVLPLADETAKALDSAGSLAVEKGAAWQELDRKTWQWETGRAEIEPGETQQLSADFYVSSRVKVVEILTWFEDASVGGIGWSQRAIVQLGIENTEQNAEGSKMKRNVDRGSTQQVNIPNPMPDPKVPDPDEEKKGPKR